MYDIAVNEAGLGEHLLSDGDFGVVAANVGLLTGRLWPLFGQATLPSLTANHATAARYHYEPLEPCSKDGSLPKKQHGFAMRPVQISTLGNGKHDAGKFLLLGVVVSNKCYNFSDEDDARRVTTGCNPVFEGAACWVLVLHAYDEGLTYAAVNPPKTRRDENGRCLVVAGDGRQPQRRNTYDHVFHWTAYIERNADCRRGGLSSFGLSDIKHTGNDMLRKMVPWTIPAVGAQLAALRMDGRLGACLLDLPRRTTPTDALRFDKINRALGALDLRRMLLLELLLVGTPLEALLMPEDHPERETRLRAALKPVVATAAVVGGGQGLYLRMKAFCDLAFC